MDERESRGGRDAPIPMQRLQAADRSLGWIACALLQLPRALRRVPREERAVRDVLLIKFWGIGSLQLLTPAAAALRARHPGARLALLTLQQNGAFARGLGLFDEVLALDVASRSWLALFRRILALLGALRRRRFERVYDFEFFTRFSAVVSFLTGAPATAGFAAPGVWRGRLHRGNVPFNRYWHVARNFRALAGGEDGREVEPDDLHPYVPSDAERAEARTALRAAGIPDGALLVVLNPNAGQLSLERRWPAESFGALARRLIEEEECAVALVGTAGESERAARVRRAIGPVPDGAFADLTGRLSIGALVALLGEAAAVVSNDSGPMHLAAAAGAPTLGLFGPETPTMYRPLGARAEFLWDPPVCSPCINVHDGKVANCIHGRPECLMRLDVERVLEHTVALLRERLPAVLLHPHVRRAAPAEEVASDPRECASSS